MLLDQKCKKLCFYVFTKQKCNLIPAGACLFFENMQNLSRRLFKRLQVNINYIFLFIVDNVRVCRPIFRNFKDDFLSEIKKKLKYHKIAMYACNFPKFSIFPVFFSSDFFDYPVFVPILKVD